MNTEDKPLSPHIQIYRPQITSILSITHRLTGIGLAVGAVALTWWINTAAYGPDVFTSAQTFAASWFGRILLLGWTLALFYHLFNGIRHLFWDAGIGMEISQVNRSGWLVIVMTILMTLVSWAAGYGLFN